MSYPLTIEACVNSILFIIANPILRFVSVDTMDDTSSPQLFYLDSLEIDSCYIYYLRDAMSNKLLNIFLANQEAPTQ